MSKHTLMISDLHLDESRPETSEAFFSFMKNTAPAAERLFILGDLFESWIGDDDTTPLHTKVIDSLKQLADSGTQVFLMHGNRDFLIGEQFAAASGCTILPDPYETDLHGKHCYLTHGDLFCTLDVAYQEYRKQVRNPEFQQQFLQKSIEERRQIAASIRERSKEHTSATRETIMDVNPDTVNETLSQHPCDWLIHGHTHRQGIYPVAGFGDTVTRVDLGDWYESGQYFQIDDTGFQFVSL